MPHVVLVCGDILVVDDGLGLVLIVGVEQDRAGVDPHIHHVLGPHVVKAGPGALHTQPAAPVWPGHLGEGHVPGVHQPGQLPPDDVGCSLLLLLDKAVISCPGRGAATGPTQ